MHNDIDLLKEASKAGHTTSSNGRPVLDDFADVANCIQWLQVLAAPRVFHSMTRTPPREHVARLVDIYIEYVRSDPANREG